MYNCIIVYFKMQFDVNFIPIDFMLVEFSLAC